MRVGYSIHYNMDGKEVIGMITTTRFGKPNMTSLPKELGMRIFKTIRSTPAPDFDKMHQESMELMRQMEIERENHRNVIK